MDRNKVIMRHDAEKILRDVSVRFLARLKNSDIPPHERPEYDKMILVFAVQYINKNYSLSLSYDAIPD